MSLLCRVTGRGGSSGPAPSTCSWGRGLAAAALGRSPGTSSRGSVRGLECSWVRAGPVWAGAAAMGGTASTRRVTFEADENENITVVKGIRLSENVIDRMKESSPSGSKSQRYSGVYGAPVSDEELKRRVAEELALEQAKKESENQQRLKQAKELDRERAAASEQLTRAILRERISNEEERSKAKHLVKVKVLWLSLPRLLSPHFRLPGVPDITSQNL
ncbi:MICOS complex subunit MIC19 [Carlito syrichta]|uniref:MICOS complex subunit MIC19 n=1 Tax=Carlito syrichta TaxID=1868482 RepID=A0A3Q0DTN0_CARSF|nr:MICOS complex subunit MIC19 [Carlito syrichta]